MLLPRKTEAGHFTSIPHINTRVIEYLHAEKQVIVTVDTIFLVNVRLLSPVLSSYVI
jgi:hypothetical protein